MRSETDSDEPCLCLHWNDHMRHMTKLLLDKRLDEQFYDVTLLSEDGHIMRAHQAVLASTSGYFKQVLSTVSVDQHPMIILNGANSAELYYLLDYMYQGVTQVDKKIMDSLFEVADMLEVKGLSRLRSNTSIKKLMSSARKEDKPLISDDKLVKTVEKVKDFFMDDKEGEDKDEEDEEEEEEDEEEDDDEIQLSGIDLRLAKCQQILTSKQDSDEKVSQQAKSLHQEHKKCDDRAGDACVVRTLKVTCPDGPVTISVTTGDPGSSRSDSAASKYNFKRRHKVKLKQSSENSIKCYAVKEERAVIHLAKEVSLSKSKFSGSGDKVPSSDPKSGPVEYRKSVESGEGEEGVGQAVNAGGASEKDAEKVPNEVPLGHNSQKVPSITALTLYSLPPVKEKEKQTRTTLALEEKIKVIEAFLDGKSQRQIAQMYGIGKTQVSCIIKRREEILSLYRNTLVRGEKLTLKRQRKSEYALLNEHLIKWYHHMSVVANVKITTGMIKAKALQIAPDLGYHDFKASNGWLATFKANNNLKFSRSKKADNACTVDEDDDDGNFEENPEVSQCSKGLPLQEETSMPRDALQGNGLQPNAFPNASLLAAGKTPQIGNYGLSRDLCRPEHHSTDLHGSLANPSPVSLSVARTESAMGKPTDTLTYKSEESIGSSITGYGYDGRVNDPSTRGSEYNYAAYGFPGSYYGYHFLGQY